ncbi:MAG: membrane protein YqaA with SNARE-associated domain [Motiliproteus sp.]
MSAVLTDSLWSLWSLWGLFSSGFISSTLLPGGSELMLLVLLDQGHYAWWQLVAIVTLGNSLGGVLTWGMGYWVACRFPLRVLSARRQQARDRVHRYGSPLLLLSWLPLLGDPLCFISGWLKQRLWLCVLFICLGKAGRYLLLSIPWV